MGSVPLVLARAQWYTIYGPAARRKTDVNVESALIEAVRGSQAIMDMRAQPILNPRPQLGWFWRNEALPTPLQVGAAQLAVAT